MTIHAPLPIPNYLAGLLRKSFLNLQPSPQRQRRIWRFDTRTRTKEKGDSMVVGSEGRGSMREAEGVMGDGRWDNDEKA